MEKVNVLGTEYTIKELDESQDEKLKHCDGYCDKTSKEIVVLKITKDNSELHNNLWYRKKLLRHEIIHAFLFESGLHECTTWEMNCGGHNEQIVDWFAVQFPKIQKAFKEVKCL